MPTESKALIEQRIRKERALASMRELQLKQLEGGLLRADDVERKWSEAVIKLRTAVLAIPSRCASQFADPRHAEQVIRRECELALKQIATDEIRANLESMRQSRADQEAQLRKITKRERRVLELVTGGHTNKEVATLMGITFKTVVTHRSHLMKKLNIHDVAGLTRFAVGCGLTRV
jgi:DNA-binding NarL/FixJ family response regulator